MNSVTSIPAITSDTTRPARLVDDLNIKEKLRTGRNAIRWPLRVAILSEEPGGALISYAMSSGSSSGILRFFVVGIGAAWSVSLVGWFPLPFASGFGLIH